MINPYAGINVSSMEKVLSLSHQHLTHTSQALAQNAFDIFYDTGVRHFPVVQYRPSLISPYNYDTNILKYTFKPFPDDVSISEVKSDYQLDVSIPEDTICGPNAEHIYSYLLIDGVWYRWTNVHINGLGSEYESGLVKVEGSYHNSGLFCPYSEGIKNILKELKYPDGGGVIINHPNWTLANTHKQFDITRFIEDCLDLDDRVLGTDLLEGGHQNGLVPNTARIDSILCTGRRCWIFGQGDWTRTRGRNELLIPAGLTREEKDHACLKAYRDGAFFGRYANSDLDISAIDFSSGTFSMTAPNADGIQVTIDGVMTDYPGTSVAVSVPGSAIYVRALAYINRDEDPNWEYNETDIYKDVIYTNPIMINPKTYAYNPMYDLPPKPKQSRKANRFWLYG